MNGVFAPLTEEQILAEGLQLAIFGRARQNVS
jgi:hypothetical protein